MYTATAGRMPRDKLWLAAAMAPSQRLLLLIPTTTYRTEDFVDAARSLDVDLVIASDRPNVMATEFPDHLLTLPFADPAAAARAAARSALGFASLPFGAAVEIDRLHDKRLRVGVVVAFFLELQFAIAEFLDDFRYGNIGGLGGNGGRIGLRSRCRRRFLFRRRRGHS